MLTKTQLVQVLRSGDAEQLKAYKSSGVDQRLLADEEVQVTLVHAADRVVFHRPSYRETVKYAVEPGIPCNIWTAARAGLNERVKRLLVQKPNLLNATDAIGRTPLQRAALIYGVSQEREEVVDALIAGGQLLISSQPPRFVSPTSCTKS